MTDLEKKALSALCHCTMRIVSNGKRFRNDTAAALEHNPELKLTAKQALLLWDLVFTYRRQISDEQLVAYGVWARTSGTLPMIYQPGDHRELVKKEKPVRPKRKTRAEQEIERGKGKLAL